MKILIVAATKEEIHPTLQFLSEKYSNNSHFEFYNNEHSVNVLITGVGMVATAYQLGKKLALSDYDFIINAGIAGAINKELHLGEVVQVTEDRFYDFGAEDNDEHLISIFELGFINKNELPFQSGTLRTDFRFSDLKTALGITVQKVHGAKTSIKLLNPDLYHVESMEGAAFFYATLLERKKCCQIRAISNYVVEREKESWNIPLAINNLNKFLIEYLK